MKNYTHTNIHRNIYLHIRTCMNTIYRYMCVLYKQFYYFIEKAFFILRGKASEPRVERHDYSHTIRLLTALIAYESRQRHRADDNIFLLINGYFCSMWQCNHAKLIVIWFLLDLWIGDRFEPTHRRTLHCAPWQTKQKPNILCRKKKKK